MSYTNDQIELLAHLEANRDKTLAWVAEDPDNRWAGYAVCDLDHWAKHDVTSVAQYERHDMEGTIWDLYKEVNGIRPRWMNMDDMSMAELTETYDRLLEELTIAQKATEEAQSIAICEFEAKLADLEASGASDRETALRWLREAEGDCDDSYFEYCNELPYGYLAQAQSTAAN